jgi:hypothetical protein
MKIMNVRNIDRLHYLARLEEEMDDRDYSVYPNATEVRAADREYIRKVGNSIRTGEKVWA